MQPQTNHTFALFPPPFFCCLHHVILVCPKIRYRRIHSFIPIFPAKACISMDVLQLQSRPNNVASWLVVRFAIMVIKKKNNEFFCTHDMFGSFIIVWKEFVSNHSLPKKHVCVKNLTLFLENTFNCLPLPKQIAYVQGNGPSVPVSPSSFVEPGLPYHNLNLSGDPGRRKT